MNIINKMREDNNGTLPAYAWPGGYPIMYMDERESALFCPECADKEEGISNSFIVWEGGPETCDECGKEIECAYPED